MAKKFFDLKVVSSKLGKSNFFGGTVGGMELNQRGSNYYITFGQTGGFNGNVIDYRDGGFQKVYSSKDEALKKWNQTLQKSDDWKVKNKSGDVDSSFTKGVNSKSSASSATKQSQPSVGGASRGAGGTSTSGT